MISHLLSRHLGCPCAHAPALAPLPLDPSLDPRAAAEELGHTFLPCVLVGLSRAPDLVSEPAASRAAGLIRSADIGAVVAPATALGGEAVLACAERGVPLIAVRGNPCVLAVDGAALGLQVLEVDDLRRGGGSGAGPARRDRPRQPAAAPGAPRLSGAQRRQAIGWRGDTPRALATPGWQTAPLTVFRPESSSGRSVTASASPRPAITRM